MKRNLTLTTNPAWRYIAPSFCLPFVFVLLSLWLPRILWLLLLALLRLLLNLWNRLSTRWRRRWPLRQQLRLLNRRRILLRCRRTGSWGRWSYWRCLLKFLLRTSPSSSTTWYERNRRIVTGVFAFQRWEISRWRYTTCRANLSKTLQPMASRSLTKIQQGVSKWTHNFKEEKNLARLFRNCLKYSNFPDPIVVGGKATGI